MGFSRILHSLHKFKALVKLPRSINYVNHLTFLMAFNKDDISGSKIGASRNWQQKEFDNRLFLPYTFVCTEYG